MRRTALALLLLGAAVPTAVRLTGDHGVPALVGLVSVVPFAAVALAVLLGVVLALRHWLLAAVAAALVALNAAWLAPLWSGAPAPEGAARLTVMTANLRLGSADPEALVRTVVREHVDVLAVQELTAEEVQRLRDAGLERVLPHQDLLPEGGASGSGLWSRLPMSAQPAWDGTFRMPGATVTVAGRPVVVRVVHPYPTLPASSLRFREDYALLSRQVASLDPHLPTVVLGDFNATRDHAVLRDLMGDRWRDAPEVVGDGLLRTWTPSRRLPALLQLDHVLVDAQVGVRAARVVDLPGSDHDGLVTDLVVGA